MAESRITGIDVFQAEPPTFRSQVPDQVKFVATLDSDVLAADGRADRDPDAMWAMDLAFRFTNSIDVPWWDTGVPGLVPAGTRLRSTSVGDILRVRSDDGTERCWLVALIGFHELSASQVADIEFVPAMQAGLAHLGGVSEPREKGG